MIVFNPMKTKKIHRLRSEVMSGPRNIPLHWRMIPLFGLGIILLFTATPWAGTGDVYGKDPLFQGQGNRDFFQLWIGMRLAENHTNYERLTPQEKERLQQKYQRWKALPPEKQQTLRHRKEKWMKMSPEEKRLYEQKFHQWQQLPPDEKQRLRERLDLWDSLPSDEKEQIRRRFK